MHASRAFAHTPAVSCIHVHSLASSISIKTLSSCLQAAAARAAAKAALSAKARARQKRMEAAEKGDKTSKRSADLQE